MENDSKLYKVTFNFTEPYERRKTEGISTIEMVVDISPCEVRPGGVSQFTAMHLAWVKLQALNLPEPVSFNAERVGK